MPDLPPGIWNRLVSAVADQAALIGQLLVILVVAFVAWRFGTASIHRLVRAVAEREAAEGTARELNGVEIRKRYETIDSLATRTLRLLIILIAGATILETFRISVLPAIAGFGVVGIAVGFGAQNLVRDYLNGVLIVIENQFSKGDVVEIAGVSGTVEDFTLRTTTLRDVDGRVHTVPNGTIGVASNLTRAWARINLDVVVAHDADLERVAQLVDQVGHGLATDTDWSRRILEAPRVDRVEAVSDVGVTLKVIGTVLAADRWSGAGELRRRIYLALREAGIGVPGRPGAGTVTVAAPNVASGPASEPAPPAPSEPELTVTSESRPQLEKEPSPPRHA
jgi:small conductance mechanosensitive channel